MIGNNINMDQPLRTIIGNKQGLKPIIHPAHVSYNFLCRGSFSAGLFAVHNQTEMKDRGSQSKS